jgi:hypothetical protein
MDPGPGGALRPPLMRGARARRLAAAGAVVGLLLYGSVKGGDDLFPFGPMTQYSFRIDPDGEIRALWVEADAADGRHIPLDLSSSADVGVARAEVEGQLDKILAKPSRLEELATAWRRLHPDRPALTRLTIGQDVIELRDGREAGRRKDVFTSWDVPALIPEPESSPPPAPAPGAS